MCSSFLYGSGEILIFIRNIIYQDREAVFVFSASVNIYKCKWTLILFFQIMCPQTSFQQNQMFQI